MSLSSEPVPCPTALPCSGLVWSRGEGEGGTMRLIVSTEPVMRRVDPKDLKDLKATVLMVTRF